MAAGQLTAGQRAWEQRQGLLVTKQHWQNLASAAAAIVLELVGLLGMDLTAFLGGVEGAVGPFCWLA